MDFFVPPRVLLKNTALKDEDLQGIIDAISEDYSWDELTDTHFMLAELDKLLGLDRDQLLPIISGAIQIKRLHRESLPWWKRLLRRN